MEPRARRALKVWGVLVLSGVVSFTGFCFAFVNSDLYSGQVSATCVLRTGGSANNSTFFLMVDGKAAAEQRVQYYGYYDNSIYFSDVNVRAGKPHDVWVESEDGERSGFTRVELAYGESIYLNLSIGALSRVDIEVTIDDLGGSLNNSLDLYIDGVLRDSKNLYYYPSYASFVQYMEMNRSYRFEVKFGLRSASRTACIDSFNEYVELTIH